MKRPRPVLIYGMVLAALTAVTTYADVANVIPDNALNVIRLAQVVGGAVWVFLVQGQVTPLSSPRDKEGRRLVRMTRNDQV